jgi:drug/metabolite transporter (DMT)-like permease
VLLRFAVAGALTWACAAAAQRWGSRALRSELKLESRNQRALFLRGLYGGFAVLCYFTSMALTGAGMGTLLNYTYAVFANLFGVLFFSHRPSPRFWLLLALAAAGLVLVVGPSLNTAAGPGYKLGLALGLCSGIFAGFAVLTVKELRQTDNALSINAAYSLGSFLLAMPVAFYTGLHGSTAPLGDLFALACLLASAIISFAAHLLFSHGFKHTPVSLASLLSLLTPVVATAGGYLFLGEKLSPHFFAGAVMILVAVGMAGKSEGKAKGAENPAG